MKDSKLFETPDYELEDLDRSDLTKLHLIPDSTKDLNSTDIYSGDQSTSTGEYDIDKIAHYKTVFYEGEPVVLYSANYKEVPIVRFQIGTCLLMFVIFGINDQVTGSLMPVLTEYYGKSEVQVSFVLFLQLLGYTLASSLNDRMHRKWGSLGVMTFAGGVSSVCFAILALKPPTLYLYVPCFLPLGLCIGFLDSTGNVFFGNLEIHKNEWMGILHGFYGLAAGITPPLVTTFAQYIDWAKFFWIPFTFAIAGTILVRFAFKYETASKYKHMCSEQSGNDGEALTLLKLLKIPEISLYALYIFLYLGTEISIASWMYTYLLKNKHGEKLKMSYVTASFWSGITVGRLCLGFVTKRFKNEYRSSLAYGWLSAAFFSLFVLLSMIASNSDIYFGLIAFSIFGGGVFYGPLFPNASVVAIQVLPKSLHFAGVGAAVGIGGCGGALIPYLAGLVNQWTGFKSYSILCLLGIVSFNLVWMAYPKAMKGHERYL